MKKITPRTWVKVLAMVVCSLSVIGTAASIFGFFVLQNIRSDKELRNYIYGNIADNYSAQLLSNLDEDDANPDYGWLEGETSLRYAVIASPVEQSGDITVNRLASRIDLSDPDIYRYGSPENRNLYQYAFFGGVVGEESKYYDYNTASLLQAALYPGTCEYWETAVTEQEEEIEAFLFSPDTGIFYTKTESGCYPINHISIVNDLSENTAAYYLQTEDELYYVSEEDGSRLDTSAYQEWVYVTLGEYFTVPTQTVAYQSDADLQESGDVYDTDNGDGISGETFEDQGMQFRIYDSLADLEEGANDGSIGILTVNAAELPYTIYAPQIGYFYESTYYHEEPATGAEYYYVLSYVDDTAGSNDLFARADNLIGVLLAFQQDGIIWGVLFLILFAVSFVFLMAGAGYRKADDEVHLRIWDKIPLGIYAAVVVIPELVGFVLLHDGGYYFYPYYMGNYYVGGLVLTLIMAMGILAVMSCLALVFCMSVAVRIKAGCFLQNTILYICGRKILGFFGRIIQSIREIARAARENLPLFWKTVLVLVAVFVAEVIFLCLWMDMWLGYAYPEVVLWLVIVTVLRSGIVIWAVLQMGRLQEGTRRVAGGDNSTPIDTHEMFWEFKKHAENINKIGDGSSLAVEQQMKSERFKTELITNVSHDIKTPLTSIINYVDLIKKEEIKDPVLTEYVEVLDRQSARLKKLIEDLMEASKASTGNLPVNLEKCDAAVLLSQAIGEFEERAQTSQLTLIVTTPPEPVEIIADGRHLWRVFDNLLNNICKYAQPGTRVYISLEEREGMVVLTFKNISRYQLNISSEELMERFVRGDSSRNTEGSGLGLSIAQSLTGLMNGTMELSVDGDLFKVTLTYAALRSGHILSK